MYADPIDDMQLQAAYDHLVEEFGLGKEANS
jgi:hypothetical protein